MDPDALVVGEELHAGQVLALAYPDRLAIRRGAPGRFQLRTGQTAWLPDTDDLGRFDGRLIFEYERSDPETGATVTKVAAARHDPTTAVIELTSIFEEGRPGEPAVRWIRRDALRLIGADELRAMAEDAGLEV